MTQNFDNEQNERPSKIDPDAVARRNKLLITLRIKTGKVPLTQNEIDKVITDHRSNEQT